MILEYLGLLETRGFCGSSSGEGHQSRGATDAFRRSMLTVAKYLSPPEQSALEAQLARHRFGDLRNTTMLLMMLKLGTRPQELLNLRWCDISWSSRSIFIKTLKGGRARSLPLSSEILHRLEALGPGEGLVFGIKYGMFVKVWRSYRPARKGLHSLRHTFAVNLYRACGYEIDMVQRALGHSSIHTTSVYLQIEHSVEEFREFIGV